jgi:small subunit ribosomal protein S17
MEKTLVVEIARIFPHPLYRKVVRETKKVYVHDPGRKAHTGDRVRIVETRPVSKTKRWKLIEVLES